MGPNRFWGWVAGGVGAVVAAPAAWANGAYKALNGQSFEQGCSEVLDPVFEKCAEFGDRHHDKINDGVGAVARRVAEDAVSSQVKRKL